jgi:hypothetical protein
VNQAHAGRPRTINSGSAMRSFCPECGSGLFYRNEDITRRRRSAILRSTIRTACSRRYRSRLPSSNLVPHLAGPRPRAIPEAMRAGHCAAVASAGSRNSPSRIGSACCVARSAGVASDPVLVGRTEDRRAPGARGAASRNRLAMASTSSARPYPMLSPLATWSIAVLPVRCLWQRRTRTAPQPC